MAPKLHLHPRSLCWIMNSCVQWPTRNQYLYCYLPPHIFFLLNPLFQYQNPLRCPNHKLGVILNSSLPALLTDNPPPPSAGWIDPLLSIPNANPHPQPGPHHLLPMLLHQPPSQAPRVESISLTPFSILCPKWLLKTEFPCLNPLSTNGIQNRFLCPIRPFMI